MNDILDRAFPFGNAKDGEHLADCRIATARQRAALEHRHELGYVWAYWGMG